MITAKKCIRNPNFTFEERLKLISLIKPKRDIVLNKKQDVTSNKAKEAAWENIELNFNSTSVTKRPIESIKKLWANMKSEARLRQCVSNMDGGEPDLDPITLEVLEILGQGETGIANINDSDAEYTTIFHQQSPSETEDECQDSMVQFSDKQLLMKQTRHTDIEDENAKYQKDLRAINVENAKICLEKKKICLERDKIDLEIRKEILRRILNNENIPESYAAFLNTK